MRLWKFKGQNHRTLSAYKEALKGHKAMLNRVSEHRNDDRNREHEPSGEDSVC